MTDRDGSDRFPRTNPPHPTPAASAAASAAARTSLDTLQTSEHPIFHEEVLCQKWASQPPHQRWIHEKWEGQRLLMLQGLERCGAKIEKVERMMDCASSAWVYQSLLNPDLYRVITNHCGNRLCLRCGNLRAFFLRKALSQKLQSLASPPLFITLTLSQNSEEDLTTKISRLYRGFRDLRRIEFWKKSVRGGAAFLEIKHNTKTNRWHPHLHILADGKYLPVGQLTTAWHGITGDSFIVDVRRAKDTKMAANYVTKYVTKPINAGFAAVPELLDEAILAMKGRRLCLTFGDWYGIRLKGDDDDPLQEDPMDDTTWTSVGSLEQLWHGAREGVTTAIDILRCLRKGGLKTRAGPSG